jgi:mono/diheme cytochrome c family protein
MRTLAFTRSFLAATAVLGIVGLTGCSGPQRTPPIQVWPDMRMQPRFEAQATSGLFTDGRASRRRPDGVVARGHLWEDNVTNTGFEANGQYVGKMPVEITPELLAEGEWRFNTYCSPCHDRTGLGNGMVPQHAQSLKPANLTEDRLVQAADGDIFNTVTFGRRTMPPYGAQNRPAERWAIIAYVRVLQRAAHGTVSEVPEAQRATLEFKPGPPPVEQPNLDAYGGDPTKAGKGADKGTPAKGGAKK